MRLVIRQSLDDRPSLVEVILLLGLRLDGNVEVDLTVTPGCEAQVFSLPTRSKGVSENKGATLLVGTVVRGPAVALFGSARMVMHQCPVAGQRVRLLVSTSPSGEALVVEQDEGPKEWKEKNDDDE
jgi:hypothetical protein